jgi:hypothetical protein
MYYQAKCIDRDLQVCIDHIGTSDRKEWKRTIDEWKALGYIVLVPVNLLQIARV